MEAIYASYSSVPETRNPIKVVLVVSLTAFLVGFFLWKYNQKLNKSKNEDSNLR